MDESTKLENRPDSFSSTNNKEITENNATENPSPCTSDKDTTSASTTDNVQPKSPSDASDKDSTLDDTKQNPESSSSSSSDIRALDDITNIKNMPDSFSGTDSKEITENNATENPSPCTSDKDTTSASTKDNVQPKSPSDACDKDSTLDDTNQNPESSSSSSSDIGSLDDITNIASSVGTGDNIEESATLSCTKDKDNASEDTKGNVRARSSSHTGGKKNTNTGSSPPASTGVEAQEYMSTSNDERRPLLLTGNLPTKGINGLAPIVLDNIFKTILVAISVVGLGIGIYLLIVQGRSNIPDDDALIMGRHVWTSRGYPINVPKLILPAKRVLLVPTFGDTCWSKSECITKIQFLQEFHMKRYHEPDIIYNFMIGSDKQIYEGRGWHYLSTNVDESNENTLTVAFIGHYSRRHPTQRQKDALDRLLKFAVLTRNLVDCYQIIVPESEPKNLKLVAREFEDKLKVPSCPV